MRLLTGKNQNEGNKIQSLFPHILVAVPLEVPLSPCAAGRFKRFLSFLIKVEISSQGTRTSQELWNSERHCQGPVTLRGRLGQPKSQPQGPWLRGSGRGRAKRTVLLSTITQPLAAPHLQGLWPLVSPFLDQSLPRLSTTEASPVGGQDKAGTAAAHVHLRTGRSERILLL